MSLLDEPFFNSRNALGGRLFDSPFFSANPLGACNVVEKPDHILVSMDLPGMSKDEIKVELSPENVLTVEGERKSEKVDESDKMHVTERSYGHFLRRFQLPEGGKSMADGITCKYNEGVLEIKVPKSEEAKVERESRQLQID